MLISDELRKQTDPAEIWLCIQTSTSFKKNQYDKKNLHPYIFVVTGYKACISVCQAWPSSCQAPVVAYCCWKSRRIRSRRASAREGQGPETPDRSCSRARRHRWTGFFPAWRRSRRCGSASAQALLLPLLSWDLSDHLSGICPPTLGQMSLTFWMSHWTSGDQPWSKNLDASL